MCQYISFFFNDASDPIDVKVACLSSHGDTENMLDLGPEGPYTEGHYLPNGTVECRIECLPFQSENARQAILKRWPTFRTFEQWAITESERYYRDGFDRNGYNRYGFDRNGYNRNGYNWNWKWNWN